MAHLGRNLLRPSWAQLRPNFAKNLHHIVSETSRSAPRPPKTTQRIAKWVQDSPWGSNFHGFGVDSGIILSFSFSLSFYLSWPPCLKFGIVAALRAQRFGYPPPPRSGGRACVNLVSNPADSNFPTLLNGSRGSAARAQMPAAARISNPPHSIFRLKLAILGHLCPS